MKLYLVFFLFIVKCNTVLTRDTTSITFIKEFLLNEMKPTILILKDLCWDPYAKLKLARTMSAIGIQIITSIENYSGYQKHQLLILVDLDCKDVGITIENASSQGFLKSPYRWLVLCHNDSCTEKNRAYGMLQRSPLLTNSDLVLAKLLNNNTYYLKELYRISIDTAMLERERGWCNSSALVDTREDRELFRRRKDLMLQSLTMTNVVVNSNTTYYHLPMEDRLELHYDSLAKMCWIIAKMGFQMLNATPKYTFTTDCGYKVGEEKWTGIINDFLLHKADLGTSCYISRLRLDVIDFIEMVAPTKAAFVFRQPPLSHVSNIFVLPFSTDVWIAFVVSLFISAITLYLSTKWESVLGKSSSTPDGGWGDVVLLTMGAVCQQGCVVEPRKASGRMILLFLCMALMAVYAAYSANIVVLLQASSNSINSVQQLHDSKLTLAAHDQFYNKFLLKELNDTVRRAIYKRIAGKDGQQHFYEMEEGVEKIRQGMFAYHSITEPVYRRIDDTFLETEKCDLVEIDLMNQFDLYQPVAKNSPYKELFQVVFKQIRESGLKLAIQNRYQVKKPKCSGSVVAFSSVGFTAFYPSMVFLTYGVLLSMFFLALEIITHNLLIKKSQQIQQPIKMP